MLPHRDARSANCPSLPHSGRLRDALLVCCIASALGLGVVAHTTGAALSRIANPVSSLLEPWVYSLPDEQGAELGWAVGSAGNVNNDTYDDILVGAPKASGDAGTEGRVYVFHGPITPSSTAPTTILSAGTADAKGSRFGAAVAAAGNLNGDDYDDVIVGAPVFNVIGDPKKPDAGAIFAFYGTPSGLPETPDWTVRGDQADGYFGAAMSSAGNVNDDDYDDIIVGAPGYGGKGAVFVFLGSAAGPVTGTVQIISGTQTAARFGSAVAGTCDVNGDGYDDIIVGAPGYHDQFEDEGAAFVYLGSSDGITTTGMWQAFGGQTDAEFGSAVACVGSAGGDAYDDIAVGAPSYDGTEDPADNRGLVRVFYGSATGLAATPGWAYSPSEASSRLGASLGGGDVNDDGYGDLVVGVPTNPNPTGGDPIDAPEAALVFLGSSAGLHPIPVWRLQTNQGTTDFGFAVGTVDDTNGDGYDDIIVGAPYYQRDTDPVGRAFLYRGAEAEFYRVLLPLVLRANP